jgi:hypothetical protein
MQRPADEVGTTHGRGRVKCDDSLTFGNRHRFALGLEDVVVPGPGPEVLLSLPVLLLARVLQVRPDGEVEVSGEVESPEIRVPAI